MSSSPPPPPPTSPLAVVAVTLEATTDVDMDDDDSQWEEESEDDDDNQWEESEDDENMDEDDEEDDEGRKGSAGALAAVVEEHGAEIDALPTCCICMEPWTTDGAHRICCIPCGHVYGRSCLEKWLRRCGNTSAKCPQCSQRFEHKHITNLHVSGDLWDNLYRLKTLAQGLEARLAATDKKIEQLRSNDKNERLEAQLAMARDKLDGFLADMRSELAKEREKLEAELSSRIDAAVDSRFESILQSCWQQAAQDAAAAVQAEFLSMKEQMSKMADQHNATPADLLRFMEHNGAKLWEAIRSRPPPAAMPACNGGTI